jgi:excisionase family DNA binding protein
MTTTTDAAGKLAYSVSETAKLLSVGRTTLYQMMDSGRLRYVQIGGRKRIIPHDAISELLKAPVH